MSWEFLGKSKDGTDELMSDETFDLMSETLRNISKSYIQELGRLPSTNELVRTFEKALRNSFLELAKEGRNHSMLEITSKLSSTKEKQKYAVGDVLQSTLLNGKKIYGRVFFVDRIGPRIAVYDSIGMNEDQLDVVVRSALITKICPIHKEILQDSDEWRIVGNRKLEVDDLSRPYGPLSVSGRNEHLIVANSFYGLLERELDQFERAMASDT